MSTAASPTENSRSEVASSEVLDTSLRLSDFALESCCRIVAVEGEKESERLKSMGLCIGRTLEVVKAGDPLVVKVYGTRIGLSARLAMQVRAEPCPSSPRCWQKGLCPVELPHGL
jgi:Fe2+ transport system protein FeoA